MSNSILKSGLSSVHRSLLVDEPPKDLPGISILVSSSSLGENFVSFFRPARHLVDFALGNVSGKGIFSALTASAMKGEISKFANSYRFPPITYKKGEFWKENSIPIQDIIQNVHHRLEKEAKLLYGRLDLNARTLSFIDCGFIKPLYFQASMGKAVFIESTSFEIPYEEGDFFLFSQNSGRLCAQELSEKMGDHYVLINVEKLCPPEVWSQGTAKFNSVLTQLEAVRILTKELCQQAPGVTVRMIDQMQLAMDEAFTNIVIHGYKNKPGSPICIHAEYFKDEFAIEISDQGMGFNPFALPPVNLLGDQNQGYGWYLIRQIVDRIVYTPKQDQNGWNHLKLFKRYSTSPEGQMELTALERNGILVLHLDLNTLDAKQAQEFKEKAMQALNQKGNKLVIFDLEKLKFIDSSGLGVFLSLLKVIKTRGGHLCLSSMTASVKTVFELISMQKIFDCCDTIEQAIQHLLKISP